MVSPQFTEHGEAVCEALADGLSTAEAAERFSVAERTITRWLTRGRENPDGPYGSFAARVAQGRSQVPQPRGGAVSGAVGTYLAALGTLDAERDVQAALAGSLAQAIDSAGRLGTAAALGAIPRLARQLADVLLALANDESELERRRLERMLAPLTEGNS